jgi:uncharacterized membrane protein
MLEPEEQKLDELSARIAALLQRQDDFSREIRALQSELQELKIKRSAKTVTPLPVNPPVVTSPQNLSKEQHKVVISGPVVINEPAKYPEKPLHKKEKVKTPLEEFIGTNLLNKIGIAVLVFGLAIGAKYAIDHDLISPLTRIVLGYISGGILIVLAIRLKTKYHQFSAVLLSGGMAVLYFMTFAAYSFYDLIPQTIAFILMVMFTAFTVFAALQYDQRAIAIIGLIGAYAVPFLLSDGSGRVVILFTYVSIINAGILALSVKKAWKILYFTAFILTWLIYAVWFVDRYDVYIHLWTSLIFSTIFFTTFYATFLSYKLVKGEALQKSDIIILLTNAFIYYGFGYYAIAEHESGDLYLGLFTLFNAVLHFTASVIIFRNQKVTRDTFYLVAGMVLVFLTLAVPVQFDGQWVTLIWAAEATLMFWIGRTKNFPVYEKLSYGLVLLTFFSLFTDLTDYYPAYYALDPALFPSFLINIQLISALLICGTWGYIAYLKHQFSSAPIESEALTKLFGWIIPVLIIGTLYISFFKEIDAMWRKQYALSAIPYTNAEGNLYNEDLLKFNSITLLMYSSLFIMMLWYINKQWVKNDYLKHTTTGLAALILLAFVSAGLSDLSDLRSSYLHQEYAAYYFRDAIHILIRYISFAAILPLLWIVRKNTINENFQETTHSMVAAFIHLIILCILSNELINILDLTAVQNSDRLALSILWGVYALGLIIYGLSKDKKFMRIMAFTLFGITLIKLFFYDMPEMSTISKTIVMVILGALLLSASFLYNKFKEKNAN